jgi:hypothetical protein
MKFTVLDPSYPADAVLALAELARLSTRLAQDLAAAEFFAQPSYF